MKLASLFATLLFVVSFSSALATKHIIMFGGTLGNNYNPVLVMNVAVGDTIRWEGEFSTHPFTSDMIPNGAAAFDNNTGTSFEYVPTVAGTYGFHCLIHGAPGNGMAGGFIVGTASVHKTAAAAGELFQNYPNPATTFTTISFNLATPSQTDLKLYTIDGKQIATVTNELLPVGIHKIPFDLTAIPKGLYLYKLTINDEMFTRELIVTK